jgi:hypothetical protein
MTFADCPNRPLIIIGLKSEGLSPEKVEWNQRLLAKFIELNNLEGTPIFFASKPGNVPIF